MDTVQVIKAELETRRSPEELLSWCSSKIEHIGSTNDGKNAIRMGRGLCKPLVEEIYPLAVWASREESVSSQALIEPRIGSQSFDAVVWDPEHRPTSYFVEVTQAHMGQSEHFRMLHLEKEGWAPGPLSEMVREGKRGGLIKPGRVMTSLKGHIEKTRELICDAVTAKIKKNYNEPIALVVALEDFILKNDAQVGEFLHKDMEDLIALHQPPFFCFFLVGMSGHILVRIDNES